jgi:hypothetical protein
MLGKVGGTRDIRECKMGDVSSHCNEAGMKVNFPLSHVLLELGNKDP